MRDDRDTPSQARDSSPSDSTDADRLRALLKRAGLSQRAAARVLNVEERTVRQWCAGNGKPPESVFRALSPKLTQTEHLQRMIESNEGTIEALRDGPSDPQSVPMEIVRLRKQNEEHRAMLRMEEAFQRKQNAYFGLIGQYLPHGNGVLTDESMSEVDAANEEFRVAHAEWDRITAELRAGTR